MKPSTSNLQPSRVRGLWWRASLVLAVGVLLFLMLAVKHGGASTRALVNIYINTNGMPTILGISLGKGVVRDVTFHTLRWAHVPVRIIVPSLPAPPAVWVNDTIVPSPSWQRAGRINDTNFFQTMDAVAKSGLVPTTKPSGPSPYE